MSKREKLIQKYAEDLKQKCKVKTEMESLTNVTIACGPAIFKRDSESDSSQFISNKLPNCYFKLLTNSTFTILVFSSVCSNRIKNTPC